MKLFKVRQHLQGRKIIENFIKAKNEDDAKKKCEKNKFIKKNWSEVDEEYRLIDTEFELIEKGHISKKGNGI